MCTSIFSEYMYSYVPVFYCTYFAHVQFDDMKYVCIYLDLYIYIYIYIVYILLTVDSTHLQKMNNNNNSTSSCSHQPAAGCFSPSLLKVFPGFRLQGFASTTCFRHRCGCQGSLGRDGGWMMFWTQVGCRGCFFLFVFFAGFVFCLFCFCVFFVFCL